MRCTGLTACRPPTRACGFGWRGHLAGFLIPPSDDFVQGYDAYAGDKRGMECDMQVTPFKHDCPLGLFWWLWLWEEARKIKQL